MQPDTYLGNQKTILALCGVTVLVLFAFLTKPFHIDDPMFIWAAQQIQNEPLDFYGFQVSWYNYESSMAEANKNPPLISFYIAVMAAVFGWSEPALHFVFLLPAVLLIVGVFRLSTLLNAHPIGAAMSVLSMPAFLVSSTSIMADVPMTALWVWSVYYWVLGLKSEKTTFLYYGAFLAGLAGLTKFVGISIIPLLAAYTLLECKQPRKLFALALPVIMLTTYHVYMFFQYQQSIFTDVFQFAANSSYRTKSTTAELLITGIVFLGGSILVPICYLYPVFRKKQLLIIFGITVVVFLMIVYFGKIGATSVAVDSLTDYNGVIHGTIFVMVAFIILALPVFDILKRRSPESILLALWVFGLFIFACFVNWNTNACALLPMAPAVSILLWRQLQTEARWTKNYKIMLLPLIPVFLLSLTLAWVDQKQAAASQIAADAVAQKYRSEGYNMWFQGTWGFQYYMEKIGAKKLNLGVSRIKKNDIVVVPLESGNITPLPSPPFHLIDKITVPISDKVSIFSTQSKVGFYSSVAGVFPFRLFRNNPDTFYVVRASDDWLYVLLEN